MSAAVAADKTRGSGIVLQPEEGQSYWQPIWANGYSIVKLSPKHAGPDNLAMGIQVIAPGGYVREHSHTPNQEILFCFAGKGTVIVDGVPHPFVPGTTVYAAPGVRHKGAFTHHHGIVKPAFMCTPHSVGARGIPVPQVGGTPELSTSMFGSQLWWNVQPRWGRSRTRAEAMRASQSAKVITGPFAGSSCGPNSPMMTGKLRAGTSNRALKSGCGL
jgi:quercetin dioxygenase-like cupin family protein